MGPASRPEPAQPKRKKSQPVKQRQARHEARTEAIPVAGIAAAREDRHIAIDVLSRFLSPGVRVIAAAAVDFFAAGVCLALAWYGAIMVQYALEGGDVLLTGLPAWIFQAVIPVGFFLMAYRYGVWFIRRVREISAGSNA